MARISIQNLYKAFPTKEASVVALENLSLEIPDQTFVSLVGPSGCGKTTLLNIIAGFENPTRGSAIVGGTRVTRPGPDRGVVFQESALFPWLTVEENIGFGLLINPRLWDGATGKEAKEFIQGAVETLLQRMGLTHFRKRYPAELSGGMRQRVSIARVLALDPDVLLMDEPFGALDAMTRSLMQEFLLHIWETKKKTVLFITHDIDEAIFLTDQVYIMTARPGRIKAMLNVGLERPRRLEMLSTPPFYELRDQALKMIYEEAKKAMEQMEEGI